jgi:hypothetical protein
MARTREEHVKCPIREISNPAVRRTALYLSASKSWRSCSAWLRDAAKSARAVDSDVCSDDACTSDARSFAACNVTQRNEGHVYGSSEQRIAGFLTRLYAPAFQPRLPKRNEPIKSNLVGPL